MGDPGGVHNLGKTMLGILFLLLVWATRDLGGPTGSERIQVLIVDDQLSVAHGISSLLTHRAEDIEVIGIAGSVEEAFDHLGHRVPKVVLMDIHLPDHQGIEAASKIVKEFPSAKVAIFTDSYAPADIHEAMAVGLSGFLLKESPPDTLAAAIRTIYLGGSVVDHSLMPVLINPPPEQITLTLTDDERHLLKLASEGLENSEIARELSVSESTLRRHFHVISGKLGVANRIQAIVCAARNRLI